MELNNELWYLIGDSLNPLDLIKFRLTCRKFNNIFTNKDFKNYYKYQELCDNLSKLNIPSKWYSICTYYHCIELRDLIENSFYVNYNDAFSAAVCANCMECINYFIIEKSIESWINRGLISAIRSDNDNLIDYFYDKRKDDNEIDNHQLIASCINSKNYIKLLNKFEKYIQYEYRPIYYIKCLKLNKRDVLDIFIDINADNVLFINTISISCKFYDIDLINEVFNNYFNNSKHLDYHINILLLSAMKCKNNNLVNKLIKRNSITDGLLITTCTLAICILYCIFTNNEELILMFKDDPTFYLLVRFIGKDILNIVSKKVNNEHLFKIIESIW